MSAEETRLAEARDDAVPWRRWGPYLSERQWGTVREDYSETATRGITSVTTTLDPARTVSAWGGRSRRHLGRQTTALLRARAVERSGPILKERLFGLTNNEANHGEDVKEYDFYLDSTPTHSYHAYLYKYPQAGISLTPTSINTNRNRSTRAPPRVRIDRHRGFRREPYFDVFSNTRRHGPEDIWSGSPFITAVRNRPACVSLPTLWFRNKWSRNGASTSHRYGR